MKAWARLWQYSVEQEVEPDKNSWWRWLSGRKRLSHKHEDFWISSTVTPASNPSNGEREQETMDPGGSQAS